MGTESTNSPTGSLPKDFSIAQDFSALGTISGAGTASGASSSTASDTSSERVEPFGLYVHVPFCLRKCPYCDFNTYAGLEDYFDQTVDALCQEMALWHEGLARRRLTSIFVGGGTPTALSAAQLSRLFEAIYRAFDVAQDCEITCEANPGTVDRDKFVHLRSLGVNRLSLGVQSFQPDELTFLGRIHDVDDVTRAVEAARSAGFDNINLDFIFGLPHQTLAAWQNTVERALALLPEHLSLYSLIIEPNTPLHHWVSTGQVSAPDEDVAAGLYEFAMERLAGAGYVHYEVSNWARRPANPAQTRAQVGPARGEVAPSTGPDCDSEQLSPYVCRHNLLYWRNQEYIGIGPGAHSHLRSPIRLQVPSVVPVWPEPGSVRWSNRKPVPGYVKRMLRGESVVDSAETLPPPVSQGETMMMGLRLVVEGVPYARFRAIHGESLDTAFARQLGQLDRQGLLEQTPSRVRVTPRGLMFANQVVESFLAD